MTPMASPVGVMHVVLSLRPGGTERLVVEMARRASARVRPAVCCLDERGDWAVGLEARGVPVSVLGRRPGFHPSLAVRLARSAGRTALEVPEGALAVGTAARLDPVKGLDGLLEAFHGLRARHPGARLYILGEGPERGALEALIARHGLGDIVTLTGHRADVRELLPGFDLYVNSSTYEGVSLTILEAMAAGLPVVATAVGGNPEVVEDGHTGVLVPPRDPRALGEVLAALLADGGRRAALGAAGRRRAEERFAFERMMTMYERAYGAE
jgi:glycosyltransferase involved in cell wall biosynthesis